MEPLPALCGLFYLWRSMISIEDYFGKFASSRDATGERKRNAERFLAVCAVLKAEMVADGVEFSINPKTSSCVSGEGLGGFRPQTCCIGATTSAHKEGRAVDWYDPKGEIDGWCMTHTHRLREYGLYIEHPSTTKGWSHWTDRSPPSGRIVFFP